MRLGLSGAALLTLSAVCAATDDRWAWAAYVIVQVAASYVYVVTGSSPRSAAAIAPGVVVAAAHAWSAPFRSMLARLPGAGRDPALWAHGGVAFVPILMFAAAQVWLVTVAAPARPEGARRPWNGVARILIRANLVGLASFAIGSLISVGLLRLLVEREWFPYATLPAFGLLWLGHTLALESLLAVAGGLLLQRAPVTRAERREPA